MKNLINFNQFINEELFDPWSPLNPMNPLNPLNPLNPTNPLNPNGIEQQRRRREENEERRRRENSEREHEREQLRRRGDATIPDSNPDHHHHNYPPQTGFKENDTVLYQNPGKEHDGEKAKFIGIREDGKYRIQFEDGGRLAADPHHIKKWHDNDPYGEEKWEDDTNK